MANVNARRVEEILTSGITAGHYVAGSNITITENQDGTETIAASGGGGGFTPTETQLEAMNSGIDSTKVGQITTNANDITSIQATIGDINTVLEEVL